MLHEPMWLSGSRRTGGGVIGKDWFFTDPPQRLGGQPAYSIAGRQML
jgi:hypothetical protein